MRAFFLPSPTMVATPAALLGKTPRPINQQTARLTAPVELVFKSEAKLALDIRTHGRAEMPGVAHSIDFNNVEIAAVRITQNIDTQERAAWERRMRTLGQGDDIGIIAQREDAAFAGRDDRHAAASRATAKTITRAQRSPIV